MKPNEDTFTEYMHRTRQWVLEGGHSQEEIREFVDKVMAVTRPKIPNVPELDFPEHEVLGVPQRAYGYLTQEIKQKHGIDKLQTSNVFSCLCVAGYNENGSFLTHLDDLVEHESPKMMEHVAKILGKKINFFIFTNKDEQDYLNKFKELLKKYSLDIHEYRKASQFQALRVGITLEGKLFNPKNLVKNDVLYEQEVGLTMGALASQIKYRTNLGCINKMENKT